jgi:diguanylate cyclase (GGDEF)-like protein/PAS domain S-box-containing protein
VLKEMAIVMNSDSSQVAELHARIAELERALARQSSRDASSHEGTARLRSAFGQATIGMALVGLDGHWLEVNQALVDLLGYSVAELRTTTFQAITHPDDLDADLASVNRILDGSIASYTMEKRYIHKQGHILWVLLSVSLVRNAGGEPLYFISQIQDISARKHAEAALSESEARYRSVLMALDAGVIMYLADGSVQAWNASAERILGASGEQFNVLASNVCAWHVIRDDGTPFPADQIPVIATLRTGQPSNGAVMGIVQPSGDPSWVRVGSQPLFREGETAPYAVVVSFIDISESRHLAVELETLVAQLNETLKRTDALYILSAMVNSSHELDDVLHMVVESAASALPADRVMLMTVNAAAQAVTHHVEGGPGALPAGELAFDELWEGLSGVVLREGQPVLSLNGAVDPRESPRVQRNRMRDQVGSMIVVPISSQNAVIGTLTAINAPDRPDFATGDMELLVTLAHQAAIAIERAALLAELQQYATIDSLTQLFNRRAWLEHGRRLVALAQRSSRPISLILLDADHFKRVNDTYGHDVGDQVLQMISACIQQHVRASDVIGRYGGEEFVILLPDTGSEAAGAVAERLRVVIAGRTLALPEHDLSLTVSQGIATMQGQGCDLGLLLEYADQALYQAKRARRNTVRHYAL